MTEITFTVPAVPIAQPRARAVARMFPTGKICASMYSPKTHPVSAFKATVRMAAAEAYQGPPLAGPVHIAVKFVLPRPKSLTWKKRPMPSIEHSRKPDLDNLTKSLLDALKGLAWHDDAQVWSQHITKVVASGAESPCVWVAIREATKEELDNAAP